MAEPQFSDETRHIQISVEAGRWPDEMLRNFEIGARKATPQEVREYLQQLKADGFELLPCCDNTDPKTGRCLGS